ncbi:MAG: GNAT family N-acetyltransferase [Chloroflexota bacterium]|nr:MAG: GNAT family N-acetyltransferase [Chloroflexota bacterium]
MSSQHQHVDGQGSGDRNGVIAGFPQNVVLQALEHNLWSLWSWFGRGPDCSLHDEGDALWFETPIPTLPYNMVLRFAVTSDIDRRINSIVEHYRRRRVTFLWVIHPSSMPKDLGDRLRKRGLQEVEVCSGMAANLTDLHEPPSVPTDFEIRELDNETAANQLIEFAAWRWHVPEEAKPHLRGYIQLWHIGKPSALLRCWMAWCGGLPVSKVALHCAAGAAGIYAVATRPQARGQGLAGTLTLEALKSARHNGYQLAVLHSTPMAVNLYSKLGFRHVAPFRLFASEMVHL